MPERFNPEQVKAQHSFAHIPFIAGPRQCIGAEFAIMQSVFVLAMVLQRYELEVITTNIQPQLTTVLKPKDGMFARISLRQAKQYPAYRPLANPQGLPQPQAAGEGSDKRLEP